jgi:hypothetical protein
MTSLLSIVGSGWPVSPMPRMQAAHSSSNWVAPLAAPPDAELPEDGELPPPASLPLLLAGRLATAGSELDPPLHAASPIAAAATRTVSPPGRQYILVISCLFPAREASR